jgi:toxin YoeB
MKYEIIISDSIKEAIFFLKKSDVQAYNKLAKLLAELVEHPYTGTGRPEKLKHVYSGKYSRRITLKHRLVYSVNDNEITVEVINVLGHYDDK